MADQCPLCERHKEFQLEFCSFHNVALANLENAYPAWNKAYGGELSRDRFYERLSALPETGGAVKDLIQHLRRKGAVG